MFKWTNALELDINRKNTGGSTAALCDAIRRGADLRIYTDFKHNEHIDTSSDNPELINEVSGFHETCLLKDNWAAAFMTTRQPISLPDGFGPRSSMSFFLYNQDGQQAIARPFLDGKAPTGSMGPAPLPPDDDMKKNHFQKVWDAGTNAPSHNFIYDFEVFRYFVCDNWQEVLAHDDNGNVVSGSIDSLAEAFRSGCDVKVGIRGLFSDLAENPDSAIDHEVFIQAGWGYYYTEQKIFSIGAHPLVRVSPAIPLLYASENWDFGWLYLRTDGHVARRLCNPYTLKFTDSKTRHALRWFVR